MAKGKATVTIYPHKIKQLTDAVVTALEKTAEELHTEVVQAQVIPFQTGNLQNESTFVDNSESARGIVHINHSTPYARRLYFHPEYNFSHAENPQAQGRWWEEWISGKNAQNAEKAFAKFYKEDAGL